MITFIYVCNRELEAFFFGNVILSEAKNLHSAGDSSLRSE